MRERRDPESMERLLGRRLRQLGIAAGAQAALYCLKADTVSAGRFAAVRFRAGTLTVRATNPIVAHELRLEQDQLESALRVALKWPEGRPLRVRIVL